MPKVHHVAVFSFLWKSGTPGAVVFQQVPDLRPLLDLPRHPSKGLNLRFHAVDIPVVPADTYPFVSRSFQRGGQLPSRVAEATAKEASCPARRHLILAERS